MVDAPVNSAIVVEASVCLYLEGHEVVVSRFQLLRQSSAISLLCLPEVALGRLRCLLSADVLELGRPS